MAIAVEAIFQGAGATAKTDLSTNWLVTSSLALIHAAAEEVHAGRTDATNALTVLIATIRDLFVGPDPKHG